MPLIPEDLVAERLNMQRGIPRRLLGRAFRLLQFDLFNERYEALRHFDGIDFVDAVLEDLNLDIAFDREALLRIPEEGPFLVVSNHPHGILDGLALIRILSYVRSDFRVVVNDLLKPVHTLRDFFLPITWMDEHAAVYRNGKIMLRALKSGTPLVFFPAGSVAHFHPTRMRVQDREWDATCLKFLARSNAPIIPVHIEGRASWAYHALYNTNVRLSLAWLIREFFNLRDSTMTIRIGRSIENLPPDEAALGKTLRREVYALAGSAPPASTQDKPTRAASG